MGNQQQPSSDLAAVTNTFADIDELANQMMPAQLAPFILDAVVATEIIGHQKTQKLIEQGVSRHFSAGVMDQEIAGLARDQRPQPAALNAAKMPCFIGMSHWLTAHMIANLTIGLA